VLICQLSRREETDERASHSSKNSNPCYGPQTRIAHGYPEGPRNARLCVAKTDGRGKHGHVHDEVQLNGEVAKHEICGCHCGLQGDCQTQDGDNHSLNDQQPFGDTVAVGFTEPFWQQTVLSCSQDPFAWADDPGIDASDHTEGHHDC